MIEKTRNISPDRLMISLALTEHLIIIMYTNHHFPHYNLQKGGGCVDSIYADTNIFVIGQYRPGDKLVGLNSTVICQ